MRCQRVGVSLLVTGLRIGGFRISHACGNTGRQAIETSHLPAGRHQHSLFSTAPAHGSGSEIGDKRPGAKNGRVSRHQ